MSKQTLEQAVVLAKSGKSHELAAAASVLAGKPEGAWAETEQAIRELRGFLPLQDQREYTWEAFVNALYYIEPAPNAAGRYKVRP